MTDESPTRRARPLTLLASVILFAIAGWHYFCHVRLESSLENGPIESLRTNFEGSNGTVDIQPVTNLVLIQVELPVHGRDDLADTIRDLFVAYISRELEPVVERQLATAARSDIDLYAMAVPYHVAIDITNVREGFSRVVQDVQKELLRLGYDIGDADGLSGLRTRQAIVSVQAQLKMKQDGQASQELLKRLRNAKPATPKV